MSTEEIINLNVGGVNVSASKSTLMAAGYFQNYLRRPYEPDNIVFVDCDYETFIHVLRKWRYPDYKLPIDDYIAYIYNYYTSSMRLEDLPPKVIEQSCGAQYHVYENTFAGCNNITWNRDKDIFAIVLFIDEYESRNFLTCMIDIVTLECPNKNGDLCTFFSCEYSDKECFFDCFFIDKGLKLAMKREVIKRLNTWHTKNQLKIRLNVDANYTDTISVVVQRD